MLWSLIMVGGGGTRLWPLSNRDVPKPFLKVIPGKESFLKETVKRLSAFIDPDRIIIIGNEKHVPMIRREVPRVPAKNVIGEPVGRNTAPAVVLAADIVCKKNPNALLLTVPADAWISTNSQFKTTVLKAFQTAKQRKTFCVFGVKPAFPSTSYGYVRFGKKISESIFELKQFVEKPDEKKAKQFLRAGNYLWHAGIFLAPAGLILDSVKQFAPGILRGVEKLCVSNGKIQPKEVFERLPNISIDYAVLEKIKNALLIQSSFEWCDVGTWKSFEGLWPKDKNRNSFFGSALSLEASGNIVYSKEKPVYLFGVDDLVVVNTPDSILVTKKNKTEEMRKLEPLIRVSKNRSSNVGFKRL